MSQIFLTLKKSSPLLSPAKSSKLIAKSFPRGGFTLIELLVVIGILAIFLGGGVVSLSYFFTKGELDHHAQGLVQSLRRAEMQSITRYQNSPWGVYMDVPGNRYVLFKGSTYASRDTAFDEITVLPGWFSFSNITLTGGGSTILFSRGSGQVTMTGTVTLSDSNTHSVTITLNSYGTIEIQ